MKPFRTRRKGSCFVIVFFCCLFTQHFHQLVQIFINERDLLWLRIIDDVSSEYDHFDIAQSCEVFKRVAFGYGKVCGFADFY